MRCDDGHAIFGRRVFREVDADVVVRERRVLKRMLPNQVVQVRVAPREEIRGIRQQEIEIAVPADVRAERRHETPELTWVRWIGAKLPFYGIHHPTERVLAVRRSDREETLKRPMRDGVHFAVVRKRPRTSPQLAREGMCVRQLNFALRLTSNVAHTDLRLDRVLTQVAGEGALRRGKRLAKRSDTAAFIQTYAPAVRVRSCFAAALREAAEREHNVGRDIAVHSE